MLRRRKSRRDRQKSENTSNYAVCFFFLSLRAFLDTIRRLKGGETEQEERVLGLRAGIKHKKLYVHS